MQALGELAAAQVHATHGELEQAERAVGDALEMAEAMDSDLLRFSCNLRQALLVHQRGGDPKPLLRKALLLGRRKGYAFCYWWRREEIALLSSLALAADIEPDYVHHLIRCHDLPAPPSLQPGTPWPWRVEIFVLGSFELRIDGHPIRLSGKVQQRPLELLKALVLHGGRRVPETRLVDCLWPDMEGDYAHRCFVTTLQRLRKLLGDRQLLPLSGGRLSLDEKRIAVDLWETEQLVAQLDDLLAKGSLVAAERCFDQLLSVYRGSLLADEPDLVWAEKPRDRIRQRFQRTVVALGKALIHSGAVERAARCFRRALDVEPEEEHLCHGAIVAYQLLDDETSMETLQKRCPRLGPCKVGAIDAPQQTNKSPRFGDRGKFR